MSPAQRALTPLGLALLQRAEHILQRWYGLADADPELSTASTLSRAQFRDHIPEVLQAFARRLAARGGAERDQAESDALDGAVSHGVVRWQQGYRQRELMREWRHLHVVLVEEIETIGRTSADLDADALAAARAELAALVSDGVCESASQYAVLQQSEAAARLRDLEQAVGELKEVQRAQAELLRQATHDLRGGLGVVHLATAALKADVPDAVRSDAIAVAERGVAAMRTLLDELIGLARLEAGQERAQYVAFDAAAMLRDLGAAMLPLAAARKLELRVDGDAELPVEGDPVKVQRIVQNLLQNALRYTLSGWVSVSWTALDDPSERWAVTVQDTGPGLDAGNALPIARALKDATDQALAVAPAEADPATEPDELPASEGVRRGEPPGEGIGLAIVKRLCELLDAQLELHSEPGKGSTFRVVLPRRYP